MWRTGRHDQATRAMRATDRCHLAVRPQVSRVRHAPNRVAQTRRAARRRLPATRVGTRASS